jgi:hypothetical protein
MKPAAAITAIRGFAHLYVLNKAEKLANPGMNFRLTVTSTPALSYGVLDHVLVPNRKAAANKCRACDWRPWNF